MFALKRRDFVFGFLSFICSLKGLTCSQWMPVPPQVNGSLGKNVILPCVFTHPKQNNYKGVINVKWMKSGELIFHCNLHNTTNSQDDVNCTDLRSSERLSLNGYPKKGDISLRISNLKFTDATRYFCRVELDYEKCSSKDMELNINAPAQILSLSLDLDAKANSMMLKCIARGNPVPEVKWTSSSGLLENGLIKTDHSNYMVISSVPFSDQNMYNCQAVNSLGRDQRTFPPDYPNCFGLLVATCFLGCLLLLGLVAFFIDVIKRKRSVQGVMLQQIDVQRDQTSIYQANETVYANVSTYPVGCETRQDDVYTKGMSLEGGKVDLIPGPQNHKNPNRPCPRGNPPRPRGPPPQPHTPLPP
ncbi:sialic acid binding Ig-like lectin 15, like [Pimephales promelas]|uniref:sialic acid binding Ig-like lectin 15, like n=1 Tax=Pimephales promelas TaxID=90988 RepID=UPI001955E6B2|nr:sialic acid binding Ig-like lectin 15, like [Pimephales promelas]XP_039506855.1 sialic acid binding Ig-like lectin 15, like [Pimephales promelas]